MTLRYGNKIKSAIIFKNNNLPQIKKNTFITGSFCMYHYSFPNITLLFAFWGLFLCTSCSSPFRQNEKYNDLKKIVLKGGYNKLPADQQAFFKKVLIEKLKNDSNFVKYNELHDDFTLAILQSTPVAGQTTSSRIKVHTDAEWLAHFQEQGFKDPEGTVILMRKMMTEEHVFSRRYPELLLINGDASLEVYRAAKKHRTLKFFPTTQYKN
jgi:hypothetical protein